MVKLLNTSFILWALGYGLSAAWALSGEQIYAFASKSIVVVQTPMAQGSGVLITNTLIATNCHVVKDAERISVDFFKQTGAAAIVGKNLEHDVCVLKLEKPLEGVQPVQGVRRWESLKVGERIYALGAPTGFRYTITAGIISQKRIHHSGELIQFDAAISPGNSGGGLFDESGKLVGLPSFVALESPHAQSLNFAWSVNVFPEPLRAVFSGGRTNGERIVGSDSRMSSIEGSAMSSKKGKVWLAAYNSNKSKEALELALNWTKSTPQSPDAWVALGRSEDMQRAGSGKKHYSFALELNRLHQDAMFYGSISAKASGDTHMARRLFQKLKEANSRRAKELEKSSL